ncbi:cell adhesion molecule 4 isoform X2 [Lingula anatina]|uniref:Cell adhesion molecule 4 isoform X2 n=1 Tax=Lingula anatina TaxID=7574 RepID=A0A1S3H0V8_LINAN|nr:cell adhesion molecule 4 isoform X2 [Lingula anatina]|eukprot:XP_013379775.1 cell adhesion molecule 4 isoform X2 [Lingula anatina]
MLTAATLLATFLSLITATFAATTVAVSTSPDATSGLLEGADAQLRCFVNLDLTDYDLKVKWVKEVDGVETVITSNGDLLVSNSRYSVHRTVGEGLQGILDRGYYLNISGVKAVDAGSYFCKAGPRVIQTVLRVLAPISNLTMASYSNGETVTVDAGTTLDLSCTAMGSTTRPDLEVYVGETAVTKQFSIYQAAVAFQDEGLTGSTYTATISNPTYPINRRDNGKRLACKATVERFPVQTYYIELDVKFPPKVNCESDKQAIRGDSGMKVVCRMTANPNPTEIYWSLPTDGETVGAQEMKNGLVATKNLNGDITEFVLNIDKIDKSHFGEYTIYVKNEKGDDMGRISILEAPNGQTSSGYQFLPHSHLQLVLLLVTVMLRLSHQG